MLEWKKSVGGLGMAASEREKKGNTNIMDDGGASCRPVCGT